MTKIEWSRAQRKRARDLISLGYRPTEAMLLASQLTTRVLGPCPDDPPSLKGPSWVGAFLLGFRFWRYGVRINKASLAQAVTAGLAAAAAAYGLAFQDQIVTSGEVFSIAWQFLSVAAAILFKPAGTK